MHRARSGEGGKAAQGASRRQPPHLFTGSPTQGSKNILSAREHTREHASIFKSPERIILKLLTVVMPGSRLTDD